MEHTCAACSTVYAAELAACPTCGALASATPPAGAVRLVARPILLTHAAETSYGVGLEPEWPAATPPSPEQPAPPTDSATTWRWVMLGAVATLGAIALGLLLLLHLSPAAAAPTPGDQAPTPQTTQRALPVGTALPTHVTSPAGVTPTLVTGKRATPSPTGAGAGPVAYPTATATATAVPTATATDTPPAPTATDVPPPPTPTPYYFG